MTLVFHIIAQRASGTSADTATCAGTGLTDEGKNKKSYHPRRSEESFYERARVQFGRRDRGSDEVFRICGAVLAIAVFECAALFAQQTGTGETWPPRRE
jgi:hypothetical protein